MGKGGGQLPPPGKFFFFFQTKCLSLAELFFVAMLVRNHKKIDKLTKKIFLQCEFQANSQYEFSYENNYFVIWAAFGLEFGVYIKTDKPTPLPGACFSLF